MAKKIRKYTDEGWALWIDGDSKSSFYLNEWVNPKGKNFVDVSTRIYDSKNVKNVNFFIPFQISEDEICDLSYMLADIPVLQALFNTRAKVDAEKNKYTSELNYDDRKVSLVNISGEFMSLKSAEYGTVITFDFEYIKEYITANEAYMIFRIPHKTLDDIFKFQEDVKSIFQKVVELIQSPVISEKFGYSLRINEARRIPDELNEIETLHTQRIKKALVTITISEDYELNDSGCYRIRRLEDDLLKKYMPTAYPAEDAIVYQWTEEKPEDKKSHYNFYFTIARNAVNSKSMVIYFVLLALMGMLGNKINELINLIFKLIVSLIKLIF